MPPATMEGCAEVSSKSNHRIAIRFPPIGVSLWHAAAAAGAVLACVRTATSDLVLGEVRLSDQSLPAAQTLPCRLDSLQRVADDVLIVRLRLPPSVNFVFRPGQFIELIAPGGQRRSYSLACAYAQDLHLELHVRAVAGGTPQ